MEIPRPTNESSSFRPPPGFIGLGKISSFVLTSSRRRIFVLNNDNHRSNELVLKKMINNAMYANSIEKHNTNTSTVQNIF